MGSWDLGGPGVWGGGPRGFRGRSVTIMVKWTNSGFVDPGGGSGVWSGGPRGFRGRSVTIMVKWTNSGFVGPEGGGPGCGGGVRGGSVDVPSL